MNSKIFEQAILQGDELLELIPQRPPIVMADAYYGIIDGNSYSSLRVEASNIFFDGNCLDESGLIEHMAQSAALRAGYLCKEAGKEIPLGFIASLNKLQLLRSPLLGETLRTQICVEQDIFDITLVDAKVFVADELIARGKMKIFLQQDNG